MGSGCCHGSGGRRGLWRAAAVCGLSLGVSSHAGAHFGSSFPVVVNKTAGPYVVSIYQDLHPRELLLTVQLSPRPDHTLPKEVSVAVLAGPTSGRAAVREYPARRSPIPRRVEYLAKIPGDPRRRWRARVTLRSSEGVEEVTVALGRAATGPSPRALTAYGLAFGLIGLLWVRAAMRERFRETQRVRLP